jgi:hypothetical protein
MAVMLTGSTARRTCAELRSRTVPLRSSSAASTDRRAARRLLTEISIAVPAARTEGSYQRATRTSVDLAQASAAVCLSTTTAPG